MNPKYQKCLEKDCKRLVEKPYIFCSYECAAYCKAWSVQEGWIGKYARPRGK